MKKQGSGLKGGLKKGGNGNNTMSKGVRILENGKSGLNKENSRIAQGIKEDRKDLKRIMRQKGGYKVRLGEVIQERCRIRLCVLI